jgi:hypothetical protein
MTGAGLRGSRQRRRLGLCSQVPARLGIPARELPFHKLVDWDAAAGRFAYDLAYAHKQPDWTYAS